MCASDASGHPRPHTSKEQTVKPIDVLVLGGAGVDTVVYVPELPLPFADTYMVPEITTRAGQTGDFIAVALAALGHRVHHLDAVGDDHEGELVRTLHREAGVPLTEVRQPAGTRRAVNLVDPQGRRLLLLRRHARCRRCRAAVGPGDRARRQGATRACVDHSALRGRAVSAGRTGRYRVDRSAQLGRR